MSQVLLDRMDAPQPGHFRQGVERELLGNIRQQVGGQVFEALRRSDAMSHDDVLVEDRSQERREVLPMVEALEERLRISSHLDEPAQRLQPLRTGQLLLLGAQKLTEREWEQDDLNVASGEMGRQLRAEQVSVAPGNGQAATLTLEPVGEELPAGQVLYLVQEEVHRL